MAVVYVSKEFSFDAAHHLEGYKGECGNLHGHRWKLEVTLAGLVDPRDGMLIDFKDLKRIVNEEIIDKFDHKYLNNVVPFNPTAENLCKYIFDTLKNRFLSEEAHCLLVITDIKLWETPDNYVTYYGG